jgi:uncharacterized protein DUF4178
MNWGKLFGRTEADEEEQYHDLTLTDLQNGYMVDYDLRTWEVTGRNTYDYDGEMSQEWQLQSADEVRFLERSMEDGKVCCTLTRRIDLAAIQEPVADEIGRNDDPPEQIHYQGEPYLGVESSSGLFREGGEGAGREFVVWTFEGGENQVLFITQWGQREFAAYAGEYVEEYQFTDILPRGEE